MPRFFLFVSLGCLVTPVTVFAQGETYDRPETIRRVENIESQINDISQTLWEYSETALLEYQSAEYLALLLEEQGFAVERGVAEMPTAFVASFGSGDPIIGILAEYDALPGVGNDIVPHRSQRPDGVSSGQGCGHNLFAAGSIGGAIAVKEMMEAFDIPGTIRLYGTPAEETVVGKVYMAKAGLFDDLDAAIHWHPDLRNEVFNNPGRAMNNFTVEFTGQAAHASADPWNGRSALDAVEMMNYGVNMMREHIQPSTRIHYVIPSAGEAPNVVPEYAKVWYYVRDLTRESVDTYYARILAVAEGAALATRTEHQVSLITGVHETLLNRPLQESLQQILESVGAPDFTDEDNEFARSLQEFLEIAEVGLATNVIPLADEPGPASGGSTDVAEVSYITPTVGFSITTAAAGIPWHSWATSASHGTEAARKSAVNAGKVIALGVMEMLTNEALLQAARADFEQRTGGEAYRSPIPADQAPPVPQR